MVDIETIMRHATIEVYEYDMHIRNEMDTRDRVVPYYIMSYLKQGKAILRIKGKEYITENKDVILIPAGVKHDHVKISEEPACFFWWHFNIKLYGSIDVLKILKFPIVFSLKNHSLFETAFSDYMNVSKKDASFANTLYQRGKGLEIMSYLLGAAQSQRIEENKESDNEVFNAIFHVIVEEGENNITLKALAERFHLHPTYLSNQFKKYFGIAPIALHRNILIEKAKDMLAFKNFSVTMVAEELGFDNISVFSRFFISKTGVSPSKFKENNFYM